jgi:hypothetical protein
VREAGKKSEGFDKRGGALLISKYGFIDETWRAEIFSSLLASGFNREKCFPQSFKKLDTILKIGRYNERDMS